jgi:hypothetical protein
VQNPFAAVGVLANSKWQREMPSPKYPKNPPLKQPNRLTMTQAQPFPTISKRVFWDVDYASLDYEKDRRFIIDKVMNYGLWDDFVAVMRYYGKAVVKAEIVKSPYLKKDVLNFLCLYLGLKPSDFECYTRRQSQEPHWAY